MLFQLMDIAHVGPLIRSLGLTEVFALAYDGFERGMDAPLDLRYLYELVLDVLRVAYQFVHRRVQLEHLPILIIDLNRLLGSRDLLVVREDLVRLLDQIGDVATVVAVSGLQRFFQLLLLRFGSLDRAVSDSQSRL